jgi:hypothetical protein
MALWTMLSCYAVLSCTILRWPVAYRPRIYRIVRCRFNLSHTASSRPGLCYAAPYRVPLPLRVLGRPIGLALNAVWAAHGAMCDGL